MIQRCIVCGRRTQATRCPLHQRRRPSYVENRRRAAAVVAHRQRHGNWCPGWGRDPHDVVPPNVLTADHSQSVAGGGREDGELVVLCQSCNSAKGSDSYL